MGAKSTASLFHHSVETTTVKAHKIELDAAAIRSALESAGIEIPIGAVISFRVPTGGDFSGVGLRIDRDNPVYVEWTESSQS